MEYGVIMAGGAGTRLWPLSRGNKPKQLLPAVRGRSLLQLSYDRLRGLIPPERIYVCTASTHRAAVLENLPELPPENLLGEPVGRDTSAAVGFPASVLVQRDKEAVIAVVTADHVISPVEDFQKSLRLAFDVIKEQPNALVTFGITATHGHVGLGYIHRGETLPLRNGAKGAYKVQAFKEKPDKATADRYVDSRQYFWNSGMFVWRADTVLRELATHLPDLFAGLKKIGDAWDTPRREAVLQDIYPGLRKISIDFGIMERVSASAASNKGGGQIVVVEMPVQWLDVGSWPALAETFSTDEHDNASSCEACLFVDSDNNIIVSSAPEHLVATIGVNDMIIVHTPDITLVCPKSESQRVKELVGKAKEKYGEKYQ